ncbi:MAG: sulfotransferase [Gaiellales bacterium]
MSTGRTTPILVTGPPRSGTTWVGMTLALDPSLGYLHEPFNILTSHGVSPSRFTRMFQHVDERNEARYAPGLERAMRFDHALGPALAEARSPRDLARVLRDRRRFQIARREGRRPLLKDPIAVFSAEWFASRYAADVVLTIRHPAAVAGSFKRLGWQPRFRFLAEQDALVDGLLSPFAAELHEYARGPQPPLESGAFLWRLIAYVLVGYRERHPDWTLVRQEDLARDPLTLYAALFESLGLSFDGAVRAEVAANSSAENADALSRPHAIKLDSRAAVASWKKHLSAEEIARVRAITGETADAFYAAEDW